MPTKKVTKKKKMDGKLVSKQPHELKYTAKDNKVSQKKVRAAKKAVGRSRKKIEAELRKSG